MSSFLSGKKVKGFMNSVGIDLNPELLAGQFLDSKALQQNFLGINAPLISSIGTTLQESGLFRFGKFSDPRAELRARRENKALVPDSFGDSAFKPVPSGRGGNIPSASDTYENIKKDCLAKKVLWEDPDFPASNSSLFYEGQSRSGVKWMRPGELVQDPQFIVDGASRFDVKQGELGDCWLLAAVACLSMHNDLMTQVLPSDQGFTQGYCGMFRFRFWHFGEWREVVVDDRLPTMNGRLIYLHSATKNEFWSALMEKAYAKLCGCYQTLKGGSTSEALEDFTGGIAEMFMLRGSTPANLLDIMLKAHSKRSLMACSIDASSSQLEARLPNGLVMGHAYSITGVSVNVEVNGSKVPLIRIRNPWGDEVEWRGAWSDNSREWNSIDAATRERLGLTFTADGEFWMSYSDFCKEFEKLEICHLGAQSLNAGGDEKEADHNHHGHGEGDCTWKEIIFHGEWRSRVNAGGCRNFLDTFWTNPQFRVEVIDPDDDDDDRNGTLIIGLMQKDRRALRKLGKDMLTIGYAIYEVPKTHTGTLDIEFFKRNKSFARSPNFINLREATGRHRVPVGTYVIIPSTFNPNEEADFMVRVFSEKPHNHEELDEKTSVVQPRNDIVPSAISDDQVKKLFDAFTKVAGADNEIDAEELLGIINAAFSKDFKFNGFSLETSRSLVAMMDVDRSGKLSFEEFRALWELLRIWKTAFKQYDADKNGTMNSFELRNALKAVGFTINNNIFASLAMRFSRKDGTIAFDDYVMCCARIRTVFEMYVAMKNESGMINLDEGSFVNSVLYI